MRGPPRPRPRPDRAATARRQRPESGRDAASPVRPGRRSSAASDPPPPGLRRYPRSAASTVSESGCSRRKRPSAGTAARDRRAM